MGEERPSWPLPCLGQEGKSRDWELERATAVAFFFSCRKADVNSERCNSCYNEVGKSPSPDSASDIQLKEEGAAFESALFGEDASHCPQNQTQRQKLDQAQVMKSD